MIEEIKHLKLIIYSAIVKYQNVIFNFTSSIRYNNLKIRREESESLNHCQSSWAREEEGEKRH